MVMTNSQVLNNGNATYPVLWRDPVFRSNFEALLNAPRPMLCQQCHAQDGHPAILMTRGNMALGPAPEPMLISTSCQTCHVNIHGSNDPSGSRFER